MKILGLIPARGGSKGVPRKNIKLLAGKPLIAHTIASALAANLADVVVSTDDEEIAAVARQWGAQVPFLRPAELAQDATPTLPVVLHALEAFALQGRRYDAVCLLQATTPFRPEGMVEAAVRKFVDSHADTLISVQPIPAEFNPHWAFEEDAEGHLRIATGEANIIPRRQELPPAYHRDGAIYLVKTEVLTQRQSLYGPVVVGYVAQGGEALRVNIDTEADWAQAERIAAQLA